jgi:hypothetical protein
MSLGDEAGGMSVTPTSLMIQPRLPAVAEAPGFGRGENHQGQELTGKHGLSIPSILSNGRGQVPDRCSDFRPGSVGPKRVDRLN